MLDIYNAKIVANCPTLVKFFDICDRFFHSNIYLILVCIVACLGFALNQQIVIIFVLLGFVSLNLATCRDISPSFITMVLIALVPVAFANQDLSGFLVLVYATIYFVPSIILRFIFFPFKWIAGKNLIPLLIYSVVTMLGGIGSSISVKDYFAFYPVYTMLGIGFLQVVLYLFWLSYTPSDTQKSTAYFAKMMIALGIICVAMIALSNTVLREQYDIIPSFKFLVYLPWKNYVSLLLILSMPFSFYCAVRSKKHHVRYLLFGIFQYLAIFSTMSAGCILFATAMLPFLFIATLIKARKEDRFVIICSIFILIATIAIIGWLEQTILIDLTQQKISSGGSNRVAIYEHAIEVFKQYPILGGGFGIQDDFAVNSMNNGFIMMYYHSTFFQTLAATGIIGCIGYAIMALSRLKTYAKPNTFSLFLTIGFLAYAGHSMLDVGTATPFPFCAIVTYMLVICEKYNTYSHQQKVDVKHE